MSKKILIISSTPRKGGNSEILSKQFSKGAEENGNIVKIIFLREKKINYCTGCGTCFDGKKSCPQKDEMAEVLEEIVNSDVIVLATPVYFYAMAGQMKTLIDRTCSRYTEINRKEFYFILSAATENQKMLERTVEEFRGFLDCLEEPVEKGTVYGINAWKIGEIKNTEAMHQAYEMGKNV